MRTTSFRRMYPAAQACITLVVLVGLCPQGFFTLNPHPYLYKMCTSKNAVRYFPQELQLPASLSAASSKSERNNCSDQSDMHLINTQYIQYAHYRSFTVHIYTCILVIKSTLSHSNKEWYMKNFVPFNFSPSPRNKTQQYLVFSVKLHQVLAGWVWTFNGKFHYFF